MRESGSRAFVLVSLVAVVAHAETTSPPPAARVQITSCPAELADRLPSVVKLEIDVLLRERGPTRGPPDLILVQCEEERARIEVTMDGASRVSTIDLRALAAEHRARAVALAAAELVHSMSSLPLAPEPPSISPPAPLTAPPQPDRSAPVPTPRSSSPRPALFAGALAEAFGRPAAPLFGARVETQYPLGPVVVPALSIDGVAGGVSSRSSRVSAQTLSAGGHVYFGTTTGNVRWEAGLGGRLGWVHLTGKPDPGAALEGRSLSAAWGGPEARARIAYGASSFRSALVALELGAGFVTLPVRGLLDGTERVYAIEGPWMSVCVEVGLGL